ncbi:TadE family protein [Actinomadura rupiterrae]|uniref:TadE family protein n=1 Tax=Actinomadura rupiterrae TaxID=559627 RepID=UPI0020A289CF|nr:TadE family protein [Actinomadura rupiterrae]MCP2337511.1 Flp pilus assembly protein TadG [Actinomadura rupiterrae]
MSVETVLAVPVLMMTVLACTQVCLLFLARSIALAAAQEGVRAARPEHASHAGGGTVARSYAVQTAGGFLHSVTATSRADKTTVRVRVTGQALSLVPLLPSLPVHAEAAGAIEKFTTPSGRPR